MIIEFHIDVEELTLEDLCDLEMMQKPQNFSALAIRRMLMNTCPEEEYDAINALKLTELGDVMNILVDTMKDYRESAVSKKTSGDSRTGSGE